VSEQTTTKPKKKRKAKRTLLLLVAIVCFAIAGVSAYIIGSKYFGEYQHEQQFRTLSLEFDASGNKIKALQKKNKDCVAWLKCKGTNIDYPVMYTPDDPEYYLRRSFEKEYYEWSPGCLFVGANCTVNDNSFIIYGHHMRTGLMFGSLEDFNTKSYGKKHNMTLTTVDGKRKFKVMTAWYEDLSRGTEYHYWDQVGELDKQEWDKHIKTIKEKGLYDTGIKVEYGDNLMMLSTCSYGTSEQRFIVAAIEQR